jgi:DNA-3-methyladenine glycosylase I
MDDKTRCDWVSLDYPLILKYHDEEWGVPLHDDRKLFEFLILEMFQAGLNWITILKKRENFRVAFDNFIPEKVALYDREKVKELMLNAGIIRNELKINAAIQNAKVVLNIKEQFGSFNAYLWHFVGDSPIINQWQNIKDIPTKTEESDRLSHDLSKLGAKFLGSKICYAFMQAIGMVNDHVIKCFRYSELNK